MTKFISTPSRTKEILETYGLRAKKSFGQNFLVDPVIVERCAEEAHCEGAVIEIGPGIGSLTEQLAIHAKHVTAYEVDPDLIDVLKDTLKDYDNVEIILQDFLTIDLPSKVKELKEKYGTVSVCSNLPYYVTTPILFQIFEQGAEIPYITVMVQKEVGERFAAKPKEPPYGALSAEGQYLYEVKKLFNVPGRSFNPSPDVDSVIIQFKRRQDADLSIDLNAFFELVRACFKQRRKTIYNNLREYLNDSERTKEVLAKAEIPCTKRAQECSWQDLKKIFEAMQ
ncbi:MAG: 16S rRNA (adenine(1518)-N(6)/adenine(1519)-N(6))-dimethyltransferase RsmA [Solobacterium sp.]|jgi:16S rRNA (adenine1518-N6/adenine1519-N6)-dimethyltransferase|nr:16S rRNA (adenine(1518)-N(6)/adenine(1519)-N(6))-dimethyltransferase RsmA [Solobacterium sp.]MCH4227881.1 16S rRNA (adenine(1518)-N(6)/adenine(1519)-N(6))-dimethyltransferase RsmA [Solobacterium sp.]MCH4283296.1 16S rRNA (adenine(1518)-N(6)/adenine(1519)-N(6))-dimethyltransferase RsmA [Solobacterium sp.]